MYLLTSVQKTKIYAAQMIGFQCFDGNTLQLVVSKFLKYGLSRKLLASFQVLLTSAYNEHWFLMSTFLSGHCFCTNTNFFPLYFQRNCNCSFLFLKIGNRYSSTIILATLGSEIVGKSVTISAINW